MSCPYSDEELQKWDSVCNPMGPACRDCDECECEHWASSCSDCEHMGSRDNCLYQYYEDDCAPD